MKIKRVSLIATALLLSMGSIILYNYSAYILARHQERPFGLRHEGLEELLEEKEKYRVDWDLLRGYQLGWYYLGFVIGRDQRFTFMELEAEISGLNYTICGNFTAYETGEWKQLEYEYIPVRVTFVDEENFIRWTLDLNYKPIYQSDWVVQDEFEFILPRSGEYYLIIERKDLREPLSVTVSFWLTAYYWTKEVVYPLRTPWSIVLGALAAIIIAGTILSHRFSNPR